MSKPLRIAVLAFVFHGPGVAVLGGEPLGEALLRDNVFALAGTLAGVLLAVALPPLASLRFWVLVAFLVGHFSWGSYLAVKVYLRAEAAG